MRTITTVLHLIVSILLLGVEVGSAAAQSPYSGQQSRTIKALSGAEIEDLLHGRGMGLAKPAELNRYPGPMHALELVERLALTDAQKADIGASMTRMRERAKTLGAEIVALETELDHHFRSRAINPTILAVLTTRIAAKQGQLRAVHLTAHLETAAILTPDQIARYDALRGYTASGPAGHATDIKHR